MTKLTNSMKAIASLLILGLLAGAAGVSAQSYESPALRAFREQQQRSEQARQREAERQRLEFERYQVERAERERLRREAEAERKRQSDALIQQMNEAREAARRRVEDAMQQSRREADAINQQNRERLERRRNTPASQREPQVVQRREISRTPVYENVWVSGGHSTNSTPAQYERRLTKYIVVYRTVWDNSTTTTETETIPNK